ncbi:permease-like cell division protein FtsX [Corynebacterium choanae]|uniref:Cell division protein FtsX n=1 Tax=Corynebacterium choanae TaxID=1862358 RepID=A0A3G6J7U4_9CORY|nr:permease-like cell division protein FtsX [Corynebacterium choanae]AZA12968.1 Cell division protein FtsX [Corynebacterium choanae]
MRYVFREAITGLRRNLTMTIALVITTAISLALLATGILVTHITADTKALYLSRVEVMIELDETISREDEDCSSPACREVFNTLQQTPGVETVTFANQQETYHRFAEVFADANPALVQETTPEALFAAIHVRLADPLDPSPLEAVKDLPQVVSVIDQGAEVVHATTNLDSIRNATFVVALFQAIAALLLIVNMVQIAVAARRDEVTIMRMVGASAVYTNMPFVLEAVAASLLGTLVAVGGLLAGKTFVVDAALQPLYEARLVAPLTTNDIWAVAPLIALIGIGFAALTAQLTLATRVRL